MKKTGLIVLGTIVVVAVLCVLGALAFAYSGVYKVAADEPHWRVTHWLLETTRTESIESELGQVTVPDTLDSAERIRKGAIAYADMCQVCHLAPGLSPTPLHLGLNPKAPRLAEAGSHQHAPDYLFWIVKHGIKMTGMPAWGETHTDEELWDVVAFLQKLPELNQLEYVNLRTVTADDGHGHGHDHQH